MLRANPKIQRQMLQLLDAGVTVASFALAFLIRSSVLTFLPPVQMAEWDPYVPSAVLVGVLWWVGVDRRGDLSYYKHQNGRIFSLYPIALRKIGSRGSVPGLPRSRSML